MCIAILTDITSKLCVIFFLAERIGYASIYGELAEFNVEKDQTRIPYIPYEKNWETLFSGPSHKLAPLTKLCLDFLESSLERRSVTVEWNEWNAISISLNRLFETDGDHCFNRGNIEEVISQVFSFLYWGGWYCSYQLKYLQVTRDSSKIRRDDQKNVNFLALVNLRLLYDDDRFLIRIAIVNLQTGFMDC